MEHFGDHKIIRVTPGKITKNLERNLISSLVSVTAICRSSLGFNEPETQTIGFDLYVQRFKLSNTCVNYIRKLFKGEVFVILKWKVYEKEESTNSSNLDSNKGKFEYTTHYDFTLDKDFVLLVHNTPIIFKLFVSTTKEELFLSETQFFVNHIVEVANIKQEERILFTSHVIDSNGDIIAYVDLWYKFTCKQRALKALFPKNRFEPRKRGSGQASKMSEFLSEDFSTKSHNFGNVVVTDSEMDHFADSVWLVLNRNKVLKTTQSDMNNELQQRVRWLQFEANWKQTLQENAILHGKNPKNVIWRQWREENTANVKLRTYDNITPKKYPPRLTIIVVDLCFLEGSSVLRNEDIQQFYVEYSFLGYEGPSMEAPWSQPKAKAEEKIVFNFKKTFPIHIKRDKENCQKLTELIKNDGIIKFMIISEPVENPQRPIQSCQEVGYAEVPLSEVIQLERNVDTYEFEVIDIHNPIIILGYLTVTIQGILAMRRMALEWMAPKGYKLFS